MQLFDGTFFSVSKILTVARYEAHNDPVLADGLRHYGSDPLSHELIYFVDGEAICTFDGVVMRDAPSSVRFIPQGHIDGSYTVKPIRDGVCYDIYFMTDSPMPDKAMIFPNMGFVGSEFEKAWRLWQGKRTGYYAQCLSLFYQIIAQFQSSFGEYAQKRDRFAAVEQYIAEHYADADFDYRALCAESGYAYSYFCELFRKRCHMPPVQYVTRLRLERAREMLITGRFSVTRIAQECGFENVFYFSNVFKKYYGVSPTEFLRTLR